MFEQSKPFTFDRVIRMLLTAGIFVGLFLLVSYLRDVLIPFVAAVVIAYILNPVVVAFETRLRLRRGRAVLLTLGSGMLIGLCLTVLIALLSIQQVKQFDQSWAKFRDAAVAWVNERDAAVTTTTTSAPSDDAETPEPKTHLGLIELRDGLNAFVSDPTMALSKRLAILTDMVDGTLAGVALETVIQFAETNEPAGVILALWNRVAASGVTLKNLTVEALVFVSIVVVIFIYLMFILLDYPKYRRDWRGLLPEPYRDRVIEFLTEFDAVLRRYFRGQFIIAMCCGVLFAIGFTIIGLPMAIPFGLFVGALNMIPYLQLIAAVPAAGLILLSYLSGDGDLVWMFVGAIVVFGAVQLIQDAFLTPRIMGKAVGLSPVAVLLGVFIWGKLLGFLGLLLAIPLTCLGIAYYRRFVLKHSQSETSLTATPD